MGAVPSTTFDRSGALQRLRDEDFDVLVVGGGITGVGVALDAATRGLRTALVERDDFASGTSSKSSKLVHGGLRYLDQREFRLVYEALAERQLLLENAPHLVTVLPFLVPVLKSGGRIDRRLAPLIGGALWMYDLTGGLRIGRRHRRITIDRALAHIPTLDRNRLTGAYVLFDAHADDARLTLAIARTAAAHGAATANYTKVVGFDKHDGRVVSARVMADGDEITVRTRVVVNATGVWADDVRALDEGSNPASIRPAKGVHITVPWTRVRNDIAVIVPVPSDKRSVFVVPWGDHTYIGTTDTEYEGSLDHPGCTEADVAYLLAALNGVSTVGATRDDVVGAWAGLRPLLRGSGRARTRDLSRRHAVRVSPSGVVTVTGGKLTTYRRMAVDAVDAATRVLSGPRTPSRTKHLRLIGGDGIDPPAAELPDPAFPHPADSPFGHGAGSPFRHGAGHLAGRYGTETARVRELADRDPALAEPLVPGLPYLKAEAIFAVRHEMAETLDDVLSRRTRVRLLARDASLAAAPGVAALLASELGWSTADVDEQVRAYRSSVAAEQC